MLDLNFVRNNLGEVKKKISLKGISIDEEKFLHLDAERRKGINSSESLKSRKNAIAKEIGMRKRTGEDTASLEQESIRLSSEIEGIGKELAGIENEFHQLLLNLPNLPLDTVPRGKDASENQIVRTWGEKPSFNFNPRPHWELGEINQTLDFPRAGKIASARFSLSRGSMAKLERALMNLMLDTHTADHGYTEIVPPFMANSDSLTGTGNLPKFKDDLFKIENYDLYLIPTAEVPLTNIHRDEILPEEQLPLSYVAYSPCFRSEAGSHGRDVRGLIRLHQFNKVELLKFTTPEESVQELENLTRHAESILRKLNLHYRVVALCTGDLSFSSAKTYDLEVWMPSRDDFVEISSCSNFTDFQARRARIKYRTAGNKKEFVHTLNGSGLAIGRTVAAVMENYQNQEGTIRIPEILKAQFGGKPIF